MRGIVQKSKINYTSHIKTVCQLQGIVLPCILFGNRMNFVDEMAYLHE